jgi:hypothetical protein
LNNKCKEKSNSSKNEKKKTFDGKLLAVKNFGFSFYQKAFFFSNKKFQVINLLVKTIKVSLLF